MMEEITGDSALMKRTSEAYAKVYGSLDDKQTFRIDQMTKMFVLAAHAYRLAAMIGKCRNDTDNVSVACEAGVIGEQFLIHYGILKESFGLDGVELEKVIDRTSDWLRERNWICIPEPYDSDGKRHIKTASGMVSDIRNIVKAYDDIKKVMAEKRMLEAESKRRSA